MKHRYLVSHQGKIFASVHAPAEQAAIRLAIHKSAKNFDPTDCIATKAR